MRSCRLRGSGVWLPALAMLAMPATASAADPLELKVESATASRGAAWEEVWVEVVATVTRPGAAGGAGIPVVDPTATLKVDGTALEQVTWSWADSKIAVLFLVDVSLSMRGAPISGVRDAIWEAIPSLRGDMYGVITFGDEVEVIQPLNEDPLRTQGIVRRIEATGRKTRLYKALEEATRILRQQTDKGRRAIVVLSDGHDDSGGEGDLERTLDDARKAGVRVFTLGFASQAERSYLPIMKRMADETGGIYLEPAEPAQFGSMYRMVEARLHDEKIRVRGRLPASACDGRLQSRLCDGRLRNAELVVEAEGLKGGPAVMGVTLPDTYVAPPPPFWKKYLVHLVIGGGVAMIAVALAIVFAVRASRRRAIQARTCTSCGTLKDNASVECPECRRRQIEAAEQARVAAVGEAVSQAIRQAPKTILCRLVAQDGPSKGLQFAVTEQVAVLGRDHTCTIVFPEEEKSISRKQAEIYLASGEWRIRNLTEHRTTMVNGRQVDDYPLRHGDVITLGKTRFQFLGG